MKSCKRFKAFTLSEIVIATVIIGVVASAVLQVLNSSQSLKNNEYVNGLKKAYMDLSIAANTLKANNNGTLEGSWVSTGALNDNMREVFSNSLKITTLCNQADAKTKCWPEHFYLFNNTEGVPNVDFYSMAVLNDGMLIMFASAQGRLPDDTVRCNLMGYAFPTAAQSACGVILVDVNGFRRPNTFGRDIFRFYVSRDRIIPEGDVGTITEGNSCPQADNGLECTASLLKEGKMTY